MSRGFTRAKPLIVIKCKTDLVSEKDVRAAIGAVQKQVSRDFHPAWGIDAQIVYDEGKKYKDAYRINILTTGKDEDEGYIGYHFSDNGYPVATIFAQEDLVDDKTICDTLSHEVLEMLVDPACNLYAHRPASGRRPGRGYFYEVCDPVQRLKYKIDGQLVCNFVYPEWFEHTWPRGSRKFDHRGELDEPFQVLEGCYADIYERKGETGVGGFRTIWGGQKKKRRKGHRNKQRLNVKADMIPPTAGM